MMRAFPGGPLALAVLMLLGAPGARADEMTQAKRADIKALMVVNGTSDLAGQLADSITSSLALQLRAKGRQDVPASVLQATREDLVTLLKGKVDSQGGLREKVEDAYGRAFTHQEIKDLAAFFRSALGKKWVSVNGQLGRDTSHEMQVALSSWRGEIERAVNDRLRKEGVDTAPATPAQPAQPPQSQPKAAPAQPK